MQDLTFFVVHGRRVEIRVQDLGIDNRGLCIAGQQCTINRLLSAHARWRSATRCQRSYTWTLQQVGKPSHCGDRGVRVISSCIVLYLNKIWSKHQTRKYSQTSGHYSFNTKVVHKMQRYVVEAAKKLNNKESMWDLRFLEPTSIGMLGYYNNRRH